MITSCDGWLPSPSVRGILSARSVVCPVRGSSLRLSPNSCTVKRPVIRRGRGGYRLANRQEVRAESVRCRIPPAAARHSAERAPPTRRSPVLRRQRRCTGRVFEKPSGRSSPNTRKPTADVMRVTHCMVPDGEPRRREERWDACAALCGFRVVSRSSTAFVVASQTLLRMRGSIPDPQWNRANTYRVTTMLYTQLNVLCEWSVCGFHGRSDPIDRRGRFDRDNPDPV